ncbi:MAG: type II secretion system inner membrane protein GspF [Deltaproteobacteria bacterium]|nr:type II secretion system inner membrane protein GspF [Deltaproteobacteria bacterium]
MPVFAYKGVTEGGRATRGFVDAESARAARAKLKRDGVFLTELAESAAPAAAADASTPAGARPGVSFSLARLRRISALDLALATRQLSTLVGAGVPLVQALSALTEQVENMRLKGVIARVRDRVNEGSTLADAMAQAGPFEDLYVGMVRAGEAGGALEQVLDRLADYLESQVRLRNKVTSILIYPTVMLGFALVVVAVLVTVVLPQITELLASLDRPLPWFTKAIISGSHLARTWWWAIALLLIGGVAAFRAVARTTRGRAQLDTIKLRLPVVGRTVRLVAISRFTRTLSTLLAGGIPIVRALDISKHVANNVVLGAAIDAARESVTEGQSLASPLRASGEFPPVVVHMVEVGERSGELEAMLEKVAQTYEEQVETSVSRLTALLEPLLILLMVGIVIVIIAATLVPLLDVTSSLGT